MLTYSRSMVGKTPVHYLKHTYLSYTIEYCREELDVETKTDGTIVRTKYGIERIPDPMLLKEMQEYADGVNVDRLVSFAALVAFMRIQQANRGYSKRVIMDDASKNLQKSENLFKLNRVRSVIWEVVLKLTVMVKFLKDLLLKTLNKRYASI
jgi:hypothetical protein